MSTVNKRMMRRFSLCILIWILLVALYLFEYNSTDDVQTMRLDKQFEYKCIPPIKRFNVESHLGSHSNELALIVGSTAFMNIFGKYCSTKLGLQIIKNKHGYRLNEYTFDYIYHFVNCDNIDLQSSFNLIDYSNIINITSFVLITNCIADYDEENKINKIEAYLFHYKLNYIIFKLNNVYLPNDKQLSSNHDIALLMQQIIKNEANKYNSNIFKNELDILYFNDVMKYIAISPFYKHFYGEIFHIESSQLYSLQYLENRILNLLQLNNVNTDIIKQDNDEYNILSRFGFDNEWEKFNCYFLGDGLKYIEETDIGEILSVIRSDIQKMEDLYLIPSKNEDEETTKTSSDCLIILLGQTRTPELTYNSFIKHMLNITKCDYALCVGTEGENRTNNPFYENANYVWVWNETGFNIEDDSKNWETTLDFIFNQTAKQEPHLNLKFAENKWKQRLIYDLHDKHGEMVNFLGPAGNQTASGGIQIFFRQFLYLKMKKLGLQNKYKWIMHSRADYKYLCDFPINDLVNVNEGTVIDDSIWITRGMGYGGTTDRNLLASSKIFMQAINIATSFFINYEKWYDILKDIEEIPIELVIRKYFELKQIWDKAQFYDQTMYLVKGKQTHGRMRRGWWDKKQNLYIKYPFEYRTAKYVCSQKCVFVDKWMENNHKTLDLSSLSKEIIQYTKHEYLFQYTPCNNYILCNKSSVAAAIKSDIDRKRCNAKLAIWKGYDEYNLTYNEHDKQWKFTYNNGGFCENDSFASTFNVYWICNENMTKWNVLNVKTKHKHCSYSLVIESKYAC